MKRRWGRAPKPEGRPSLFTDVKVEPTEDGVKLAATVQDPPPRRPLRPVATAGVLHVSPTVAGFGPQEVGSDKWQAEMPFTVGQHCWILLAAYRVDPLAFMDGQGGSMDARALLSFDGPVCWWCGKTYSPAVARRYCKGSTRE